MSEMLENFDICDPLPTGTTLLEASAGTGKTWTIGALVTRYVAEGVATLDQMLVVTFGRAASQELRERVRSQLVEAERALASPAEPRASSDLLDLLLDVAPEERDVRRQRIRNALGSFDAATIATTHQFCQMVLRSLGVAGDTDANATLVDDLDDLLAEVVDDLYLRHFAAGQFATGQGEPPFSHGDAMRLAREATKDPQARLEPTGAELESPPGQRVAFATEVRDELDHRKRRLGILSYDDLLSQLAAALTHDDAPARQRMRQRWSVVLVDEFQDTDPVQWAVLDRAFSGHSTMVLIGDPKQAIYAFRGGDVTTYLHAKGTATTRKTLSTNWRSDRALVEPLQVVLRAAALGDEDIVVRDVSAFHRGSRLSGAGAQLRLRVVDNALLGKPAKAKLTVAAIRAHIAKDVARDIARLLTCGAQFDGRALHPRDVAVLAYKHSDLLSVQRGLAAVGVPAVVAGGGSVFATPAATEWLILLEALEQPHRFDRVRSAALTSFLGYAAAELDSGGDALADDIAEVVRDWAELLTSRGVAAVLELANGSGLPERVLSRVGGERLLTDLCHVAQSLHQVAAADRLGPVALLTWLRAQMADGKVEIANERTRRLDSDAAAVQLVTIHGSKGLQYPVVYLPSLWDRFPMKPVVPLFHWPSEPERGRRCIDVGGGGRDWSDHVRQAMAEDAAESLRLLYVAMTRAQSHVVAWWAPAPKNTPASPLHRMLFGRRPDTAAVPDEAGLYDAAKVAEILDVWQAVGGPVWEPAALADLPGDQLPVDHRALSVRRFGRVIDTSWRRTSYTGLSSMAAVPAGPAIQGTLAVGSEPEERPKEDESDIEPELQPLEAPPVDAVSSPMGDLPIGATFGSLVHAVLEVANPSAPDLRGELLHHIGDQLVRWPVDLDPGELADALVSVYDSPLGPLTGWASLRDIAMSDRLCEMSFELPLSGGDVRDYPIDHVTLGDIAPLLRRHLAPGDPLLPYADALTNSALGTQDLRGYLTGSIDVVLRVVDGRTTRYLVVDYKTNWLGGFPDGRRTLTSEDYRPAALSEAMSHSDYPLQALLYAVVLHRYLRWRLPAYNPATHLGGVLYLYVRGMCGPNTPVIDGHPCGVFSWQPPVTLVEELSALLDGAAPTGALQ